MLPWRSSGLLADGLLRLTIMLTALILFSDCMLVTKKEFGPNTFSLHPDAAQLSFRIQRSHDKAHGCGCERGDRCKSSAS